MATVIDSLVLELGLDTSRFTRDQREAMRALRQYEQQAVSSGKEVESQTKKTNELLTNFRREALTTIGLFLGGKGILDFVGYVTRLDAATGRVAATMAMSTAEVSAWQGAIKQTGGTAEGAVSALSGLSGEMSRFVTTGQSQMLPVLSRLGVSLFDGNRNLKTSGQLWLELADAVQGMDTRQAQAFLAMIPGANQEMINFALLGRRAMEGFLGASRAAGTTTDESAEKARDYQRAIAALEQSSTNLGRSLLTMVAPAIIAVSDALARFLQLWQLWGTKSTGKTDEAAAKTKIEMNERLGDPRNFMEGMRDFFSPEGGWAGEDTTKERAWWNGLIKNLYGDKTGKQVALDELADAQRRAKAEAGAAPAPIGQQAVSPGYTQPLAEVERKIRAAAVARGIDPEIAIQVARSEGLKSYKSTVPGEDSVGPFQLNYSWQGRDVKGLGKAFTAKTGLDAHDPATLDAQIAFALDHAKRHGWRDWHGWKGAPFAGIGAPGTPPPGAQPPLAPSPPTIPMMPPGVPMGAGAAPGVVNNSEDRRSSRGGDTTTVTATIGEINVNAPNATDAAGVAKEIGPALQRSLYAGAANHGAQ